MTGLLHSAVHLSTWVWHHFASPQRNELIINNTPNTQQHRRFWKVRSMARRSIGGVWALWCLKCWTDYRLSIVKMSSKCMLRSCEQNSSSPRRSAQRLLPWLKGYGYLLNAQARSSSNCPTSPFLLAVGTLSQQTFDRSSANQSPPLLRLHRLGKVGQETSATSLHPAGDKCMCYPPYASLFFCSN